MQTTTSPSAFPDLARIQRLARWVRAMCLLGMAIGVALPLALWSQPEWLAEVARQHWGAGQVPLQLDLGARAMGLLASALPSALLIYVLWQLWLLFGRYGRGEVWTLASARHLHRAALAMTALAPALPLAKTLALLALTLGNPPGQRLLSLGLSMQDYLTLLFGLVLLAVATVMREAVRMAEENAEFV